MGERVKWLGENWPWLAFGLLGCVMMFSGGDGEASGCTCSIHINSKPAESP